MEVTDLKEQHSQEIQRLTQDNQELASTVCELEESLNRATTKVKQYQVDIAALERSLAGLFLCSLSASSSVFHTLHLSQSDFLCAKIDPHP